MEMKKIQKMYKDLDKAINDKIVEILNENGGKIVLDDVTARKMEYYTSHDIIEIGTDKDVSGGTYIRTKKGLQCALSVLFTDTKYNMLSILFNTDNKNDLTIKYHG